MTTERMPRDARNIHKLENKQKSGDLWVLSSSVHPSIHPLTTHLLARSPARIAYLMIFEFGNLALYKSETGKLLKNFHIHGRFSHCPMSSMEYNQDVFLFPQAVIRTSDFPGIHTI